MKTTATIDHEATLTRLREAGLPERIVGRFRSEGDCLVWTGYRNKGYGRVRWEGSLVYVHRLIFATLNGPIPEDLDVLHHCDNPPCCSPVDLFLGTHAENMADKVAKGRHVAVTGEAHGNAKLTQAAVDDIRARYVLRARWPHPGGSTALTAEYGISQTHLSDIVRSKTRR